VDAEKLRWQAPQKSIPHVNTTCRKETRLKLNKKVTTLQSHCGDMTYPNPSLVAAQKGLGQLGHKYES